MSEEQKPGAIAAERWCREEYLIIRAMLDPQLSAAEMDHLAIWCNHTGLEILIDQVYVSRFGQALNIEPKIDGYRAIAARDPRYAGSGNPEWFDQDGQIYSVWLSSEPPAGARIEVYRYGDDRPTIGVARYESYVQYSNGKPRGNWATMPEVMIATAAERLALSRAFPLQHVRPTRVDEGAE